MSPVCPAAQEGYLPLVAPGKPSPSSELSKARRRRKRVLAWSHLGVTYLKRAFVLLTWHLLGLADSLVSFLSTWSSSQKSLPRREGKSGREDAGRDIAGPVGRCLGEGWAGGVTENWLMSRLVSSLCGTGCMAPGLEAAWYSAAWLLSGRRVGTTLFDCQRFTTCFSLPGTKRLRQHSCASLWNCLICHFKAGYPHSKV